MASPRRATLILALTTFFWGSSFLAMQTGMAGLEPVVGGAAAPFAFLFMRFLAAIPLHLAAFPGALRGLSRAGVAASLGLALPFNLGFILQIVGLRHTSSAASAFLTSVFVALTPLLGRVFFGERLVPLTLAGAGVSLAGVWIMSPPEAFGLGEGLTLACAVAFAFQIQLTNVVTRKHSPESVTLVMFASAVAISAVFLLAMGTSFPRLLASLADRRVWGMTLYTAAFCSVAAMWALNRYQREISPTRAAVLYMLEPVIAALLAVLVAREPLSARVLVGGAVIVGGNLICELIGLRGKAGRDASGPGPAP
jgi:drug/metabolite transporter (DMT)-like permease